MNKKKNYGLEEHLRGLIKYNGSNIRMDIKRCNSTASSGERCDSAPFDESFYRENFDSQNYKTLRFFEIFFASFLSKLIVDFIQQY